MRRDHELGIAVVTDRQTVEQFLAHWLETVKTRVRAPSHKRYEELMRLHIVPTLGKTRLVKLTPQMVEHLYSRKLSEGLSPTSVRTLHSMLHHALKDALRMGLVQRNVTEMVTPPRKQAHEAQVLTAQQLQRFLETAKGDRLEALYVVALSTGMRSGEILALRWRDVDLEVGALHLRSNLQYLHGEFTIAETKTKRSRR
jgi:integrase